ncbi:MAG: hypothetical protein ACE5OR_12090, partial [bacterium]
ELTSNVSSPYIWEEGETMFRTILAGGVAIFVLLAMVVGLMELHAPPPAMAIPRCTDPALDCLRWCNETCKGYLSGGPCCYDTPPCECVTCTFAC